MDDVETKFLRTALAASAVIARICMLLLQVFCINSFIFS